MTTDREFLIIQYRINDDGEHGEWTHGRTIEGWVGDDAQALRDQRRYVVEFLRTSTHVPVGARVQTRVLTTAQAAEMGW